MSQFNCPHCKQPAFSKWDKYLAAKWKILICPRCERRATSQPLLLAGYYLLYLANVIDLSFLAYLTSNMYWLIAMVVIWIALDAFSVYLPLAAMRDRGTTERAPEPARRTTQPALELKFEPAL
ncbi:MAG: hypothetical protein LBV36_00475 [Chromatiales bacterium]|nr:hypothetical protein [Chromatiales bacterium]